MKISIVTPTFKRVAYIEQTIKSVIDQEGDFEIEYIIREGGAATPELLDIFKKYKKLIETDKRYAKVRFSYLSEKDNGQSDAINKGLKQVTGDIVAFINDDDYYEPGVFAYIVKTFTEDPSVKWCYGKCKIVDKQGKEVRKYITMYKNLLLKFNSEGLLFSENYISQPSTFWRKEVLDKIGYFETEEYYCMDYQYWLRICNKFGIGKFLNKYLADFRYYSDSKSGGVNPKHFQDELRIAKQYGRKRKLAIFFHTINCWKIIITYKIMRFLGM